jgi:hypothetical protein
MQRYYEKGKPIRGDFIRRAVLRSDLVPVPLTLEADIRADRETKGFFAVGKSIFTYQGDDLEIIKSEYMPTGNAQGEGEAAFVRIIAVLRQVKEVSFLKQRAIIKYNGTLASVYRSAGATLRGIVGDFAISRFVCLAGEVPTFHIARALQEAGGVVRWKSGRLEFMSLPALFQQEPFDTIPSHNSEDVSSGFLERHEVPAFYSTDKDGAIVVGNNSKPRSIRYQPSASETTLRNMTSCLVHDKTTRYRYAPAINAGDIIAIQGSESLVVMTAASVFEAGADGGSPEQYTRLWLGRLER